MEVLDLEYGCECVSRGDGYGSGYNRGGGCDGDGGGFGYGAGDGYGGDFGYGDGDGYGDGYGYSDGFGCGRGRGDCYGERDGRGGGVSLHYIDHSTPVLAYWVFGEESYSHLGMSLSPKPGDIHVYDAPIKRCHRGLHASLELEDAFGYRSGVAFRVACSGFIVIGDDKFVCTRRVVLEKAGQQNGCH